MSVIAVQVPVRWTVQKVKNSLIRPINGHFEVLHFDGGNKTKNTKNCYLRLSEKLDPQQVIERVSSTCRAYIPDEIPDLPMLKKRKIPIRPQPRFVGGRIIQEDMPSNVLVITHKEILTEMQLKYSELYDLSWRSGHKLLLKLSEIIRDRLTRLMRNDPEVRTNGFLLSKAYRKAHPHFGDFQYILSTLHQIEDDSGTPGTQLYEADLMKPPSPHMINNVPLYEIKASTQKYIERICKKVEEHIQGFNAEPEPGLQTEEDDARTRVRAELTKMQPYLPTIIKQVISKDLIPDKKHYNKIRIYGEPFIPPFKVMREFLARWEPAHLARSDRLYNLLRCDMTPDMFSNFITMDGTYKDGAQLFIRTPEVRLFYPPKYLVNEMKREFDDSYEERDGRYEYEDYERDGALDEDDLDKTLDNIEWD